MTGLIILAAGESKRLGTPKQKFFYQGESLIKRAVKAGLASKCKPIIVVLGAYYEDIKAEIADKPVQIIFNEEWKEGMASSIRIGIKTFQSNLQIKGAVIVLCDQPHADRHLLNDLIAARSTSGKGIAASLYCNIIGVPILFDRKYFAELLMLEGDEGARNIIKKYSNDTTTVDFPLGTVDIDTPDDAANLGME